ncbi:MAG: hypothetical protein WAV23_01245 [Minisyncoccia bacterium]
MRKLIFFCALFSVIILFSCKHVSIANKPTEEVVKDIIRNIAYAKQDTTGLCFALSVSADDKSEKAFTLLGCVPCDSLKNVHVIKVPYP